MYTKSHVDHARWLQAVKRRPQRTEEEIEAELTAIFGPAVDIADTFDHIGGVDADFDCFNDESCPF